MTRIPLLLGVSVLLLGAAIMPAHAQMAPFRDHVGGFSEHPSGLHGRIGGNEGAAPRTQAAPQTVPQSQVQTTPPITAVPMQRGAPER